MTIQEAMSEVLDAMGFETMAREVKTEADVDRLKKYARVIVKNLPEPRRSDWANKFRLMSPSLY